MVSTRYRTLSGSIGSTWNLALKLGRLHYKVCNDVAYIDPSWREGFGRSDELAAIGWKRAAAFHQQPHLAGRRPSPMDGAVGTNLSSGCSAVAYLEPKILPRPRAIVLSLNCLRKCAPDGRGVALMGDAREPTIVGDYIRECSNYTHHVGRRSPPSHVAELLHRGCWRCSRRSLTGSTSSRGHSRWSFCVPASDEGAT